MFLGHHIRTILTSEDSSSLLLGEGAEGRGSRLCIFVAILFLSFVLSLDQARGAYDYVEISNPSLKKIPIAIPVFHTSSDQPLPVAREASDALSTNLNFTGYFQIMDRNLFLVGPNQGGVSTEDIDFKNWTRIDAELLVTGLIQQERPGGLIEMELRLLDTVKGQLLVGKRYKGWPKDQEKMIRRFCDEIIQSLTGEWGYFNSRIAFVSNGSGHKEIYISDFDGANPQRFTQHNSIALFPAWSLDAERIAYTCFVRRGPDICIRSIRGQAPKIISKKGINSTPAWVPGKNLLAATFSFSGDQDIYLVSPGGDVGRKLTDQWGIDTSPSFSPDGKLMAFVSDRSGSPQIYIKDMGGGQVRRLTFKGSYNTQPRWSPRGDFIAYSAIENGEINIYVIDPAGRRPRRLTRSAGRNESPDWSPDGSMIVYSSTREGPSRIYVMTAYGTDQRRLLSLPGEQTSPRWSPRLGETAEASRN